MGEEFAGYVKPDLHRDEMGLRTIQGYEAMNEIRKGQIRWLAWQS